MVTNAHVSLASQPQYLPHDSLAHTPPRYVPTLTIKSPPSRVISEMMVSSLMVLSVCSLFLALVNIIKMRLSMPITAPSIRKP